MSDIDTDSLPWTPSEVAALHAYRRGMFTALEGPGNEVVARASRSGVKSWLSHYPDARLAAALGMGAPSAEAPGAPPAEAPDADRLLRLRFPTMYR